MKKKIWVFLVLIVLSLSAIFAYFYISNKQKSAVQYADVPYQKNEFLMGTICTLTIYDKGKSAVLNKGMATIRHFDKEATLTEKGSVLDKINANAGTRS